MREEEPMIHATRRSVRAFLFATLTTAGACNDSQSPKPEAGLGLPDVGTIVVTVSTSGSDVPSGYTVTVDGSQTQSVGANGIVTFTGLSSGDHTVGLADVPSNCSVGDNPQIGRASGRG